MGLYEELSVAISVIIDEYKKMVADKKITFSEVFSLLSSCIATLVQLLKEYKDVPMEEKKKIILEAIGKFYDEVIAPIDIKAVPNIIEGIVDKVGRNIVMNAADGMIDSITELLARWGEAKPVDPVIPTPAPPSAGGGFMPFRVYGAPALKN